MLVWSLVIMGVATALIGLLPTYASIGIWAPILLTLIASSRASASGGVGRGRAYGGRAFRRRAARLPWELAPDGCAGGTPAVDRRVRPRVDQSVRSTVSLLGLAHPVPAQHRAHCRRTFHPAQGDGEPVVRAREAGETRGADALSSR
jgi:hypothetical protein